MNITAKFPLPHAGQIIPAGATADLPDHLARMLIARGQAKPAAQASQPAPPPPAPKPAPAKSPAMP
ncbi:MAG TPA: hypothetical protein VN829_22285 [Dongiaceae bacterium]|nr:hypothetical protein [Dongiaceae bacterium]